jgi:hypothetical protein
MIRPGYAAVLVNEGSADNLLRLSSRLSAEIAFVGQM